MSQVQRTSNTKASEFQKVGFIYNPKANKGQCEIAFQNTIKPLVEKYFGARAFQMLPTEKSGGGFDRGVELAVAGCDLIVACGGDGTLHEVMNGIKHAEDNNLVSVKPVLGSITLGTSDDFSSHIQMIDKKLSYHDQYEKMVEILSTSGSVVDIDVGRVESTAVEDTSSGIRRILDKKETQYFLNICSVGISAEVIDSTNKASSIWNKALYNSVQSIVKQFTYTNRKTEVKTTDKDGNVHTEVQVMQLFACGNGSTFGNGMHICPDASLKDGLFQTCALLDVGVFNMMSILPKVFNGAHGVHEKVALGSCKSVELRCVGDNENDVVLIEADGEMSGALPCKMEVIPAGLQMVIPSTCTQY